MNKTPAELLIASLPPIGRPGERGRPSGRRFTGASITKHALAIATVTTDGGGGVELEEEATSFFVLENRSQRSLRYLGWQIEQFTTDFGIHGLLLRENAVTGPSPAAGTAHMMEAILKLTSGLVVDLVSPNTILSWERREGENAPEFSGPSAPTARIALQNAIKTACLAEAMTRDARYAAREED